MLNFLLLTLVLSTSPFRVLFVGDSITAGYGLTEDLAYPNLVESKLGDQGLEIVAINGGVSGDTSSGGQRRLSWQLKSNPNLVVIALGGNDMLRGLPPEETKKNLSKMISFLKKKEIPVALLGMKANPTMGKAYEKDFNQIFNALEAKFDVPVMDFFIKSVAGKPKFNQADGIHPTKKGQEKIALDVTKFLEPIIRSLAQNASSQKHQ